MPIPITFDFPTVEKPEIVVDGYANESAWDDAVKIDNFVTYRPKPGRAPEQGTIVRAMASESALYIHFEANDEEPSQIRGGLGRRDSRRTDDYVGLLLDLLGTGERAHLFIVNPLGVQLDGTVVRGQDNELVPWRGGWSSWDTQWQSAGVVTADGYQIELAIPWSSVRHPETIDQAHAMFFRHVPRKGEMSSWPQLKPEIQGALVQSVDMGGPGRVERGSNLRVLPEVTATRTHEGFPKSRVGAAGVAPGLTLQYAPNHSTQVLATLNPDFSQVESDEARIVVNQRYNEKYKEKRPFFVEGQEWFSHPLKDLIYTRSMVAPLYGLRTTAETGDLALAAMHVWDRAPGPSVVETGGWTQDQTDGRDAVSTIGRARWSPGGDNMIGALVSDRRVVGTDLRHHLVGVDGRVSLSEAVNVDGSALVSSTTGPGQDGSPAPAFVLRNKVRTRKLKNSFKATYLAKDFRTENGFQPYSDWISLHNDLEIYVYPRWKAVTRVFLMPVRGSLAWNTSGQMRQYDFGPGVGFWTSNGAMFIIHSNFEGEEFAEEWFDTARLSMMGGGSWTQWLRTWIVASSGEGILYDSDAPLKGLRHDVFLDVGLQPVPAFRIGPMVGWERFDSGDATVYNGTVSRLKLELFATPTLWNRWIIDASTFSETTSVETLLAWEKSPGRAIYIGGHTSLPSEGDDSASAGDPQREWAIFTKASWVFDG
jgi:hypothetical protein